MSEQGGQALTRQLCELPVFYGDLPTFAIEVAPELRREQYVA